MDSNRLLIIDGNSIANRAFYGIMNNKMLSANGMYTNAIYGFLAILFKELEDLKPEYIAIAFDLKAPTHRHKMYSEYKGTRHGMPEELAMQMPMLKQVISDMNIKIIEKEGYEADDILGTLSVEGEKEGLKVTILSGDRDTFQLATDNVTIRIPRTSSGKTEENDYDREQIIKEYGVLPKQLIEVKGLMGDTSDNIPGVPGVGEKTALKVIKEYHDIDNLYKMLSEGNAASIKGALKEKIENNKELALLSRTLGTILLDAPIDEKIEDLRIKEWNKEKTLANFQELRFNRFIERFNLLDLSSNNYGFEMEESKIDLKELEELISNKERIDFSLKDNLDEIKNKLDSLKDSIISSENLVYYFDIKDEEKYFKEHEDLNADMFLFLKERVSIIKKFINSIAIYSENDKKLYSLNNFLKIDNKEVFDILVNFLKEVYENNDVKKISNKLKDDYVLLKEYGVDLNNIEYDAEIAGYNLNPTDKNTIENLSIKYLDFDINRYVNKEIRSENEENESLGTQLNIFDMKKKDKEKIDENIVNEADEKKNLVIAYIISKLKDITIEELKNVDSLELFKTIEMPLVEVLGDMQWQGMYLDKEELNNFGNELKADLDRLTKEIYELAGEEFNINSHQQLGVILFEKLNLPFKKKTKTGYSTDVDVLKKLVPYNPIIEKILDYRTLSKLNSTYVEGLIPCINKQTGRIHSTFMQTITATGRISSTEPNLQNIPTRAELGKNIRKAFKPREGMIYIDADYSQIELRILASISGDEIMREAFLEGQDIHKQAAAKVLNKNIEDVTKEERSRAKAVNFGIVYGISDFGLAEQLGISNKEAKEYISEYLSKYKGIQNFMEDIVLSAQNKGYVETLFHRRRYIPELNSKNYMVRQFGKRIALNTPIQGTAADIMKIAMINVYRRLKEEKLNAKLILQVHDELLIEVSYNEKEKAKELLKEEMENAFKMDIPLLVELSEGTNWNEVK